MKDVTTTTGLYGGGAAVDGEATQPVHKPQPGKPEILEDVTATGLDSEPGSGPTTFRPPSDDEAKTVLEAKTVPVSRQPVDETASPAETESRHHPANASRSLRPGAASMSLGEDPNLPRSEDSVLFSGAMIGDYRIERKVAEGGWGSVYCAIHPVIGRRAAIKILKRRLCQQPVAVRRFIDEARAVTRIGHANIVDIYTFGETTDGLSYYVMEWLQGETLRERLRRGPLTLPEICSIATPLAHALEAAHEKGIIHRDLKPENVFLVETPHGPPRVKLLDFGLAKLTTKDMRPDLTSTGEIIGTPLYMAPEQGRGLPIDARVDIYAFGGVLFAALTGRTPYVASNTFDLIAALLREPVPRPSTLVSSVPKKLDDLVVAMLAKQADDRPSLAQVHAVLDAVRDATSRGPVPRPDRAWPPTMRARASARWRWLTSAMANGVDAVMRHVRARTPRAWLAAVTLATALVVLLVIAAMRGPSTRSVSTQAPSNDSRLILAVSNAPYFEVFLDDHKTAVAASGALVVSPGVHTVRVTAPGMEADSFRVMLRPGQTLNEVVTFQPRPATE